MTKPYITKQEIADAMKELAEDARHREAPYEKLRERLGMNDTGRTDDSVTKDDDDGDDDESMSREEMYARYMGGT